MRNVLFRSFLIVLCYLDVRSHVGQARGDQPAPLTPTTVADPEISCQLQKLVDKHKVPGIVGAIADEKGLLAIGVAGVRKTGTTDLMTVDDEMHLGSCTKAMTATRIALIVESGKLTWDSTLANVFPEEMEDVHADFHNVTLTQLLTHRASLPANGPWDQLGGELTTTQQRLVLLRRIMQKAPKHKPGLKFEYSNVGYALAGAMAEKVTGQSWELLMQQGLFEPLKMTSAGFGFPGTKGLVEQPWGHQSLFGYLTPLQHDNPPSLGPAGTVHASVPDWARFASLHLRGALGQEPMLQQSTFAQLQTPPENGAYAMGWIAAKPDWAGCRVLAHDGSNTMWYSSLWILPDRHVALLVVTNRADAAAQTACQKAIQSLFEYHKSSLLKKPL